MPLKNDKRIRVDKIRKTPLEPTCSSGVFRTILFFRRSFPAGGGELGFTAQAH